MFPYRFVSIISWWVFYSEGVTYCSRKVVGCMLKYLQDANGIHLITSTGRGAIKMKSKLQTNNTNKQTKNTIELAPHLNHHVTFCDFMLLLKKKKKICLAIFSMWMTCKNSREWQNRGPYEGKLSWTVAEEILSFVSILCKTVSN